MSADLSQEIARDRTEMIERSRSLAELAETHGTNLGALRQCRAELIKCARLAKLWQRPEFVSKFYKIAREYQRTILWLRSRQ